MAPRAVRLLLGAGRSHAQLRDEADKAGAGDVVIGGPSITKAVVVGDVEMGSSVEGTASPASPWSSQFSSVSAATSWLGGSQRRSLKSPSGDTTPKVVGLVNRFLNSELFLTKSITELQEESEQSEMHRTLGLSTLTSIGIGGIIGTGIFVLTGTVAARNAGPAVVLSFIFAGFAAGFAALCYAELSSVIPVSGSAYTYTAASLGMLPAWIIGWDLILEYLIGSATVAVGWSAYVVHMLEQIGCPIDRRFVEAPIVFNILTGGFEHTGSYANIPAFLLTIVVTGILVYGIKESTKVNNIVVCIKLFVIILFICATGSKVDPANWKPFIPPNENGQFGRYGVSGILQGATTIFFAYIGFDAVSTTAQECKNPQRDLPRGTMLSLGVCTILYIAVSLLVTGLVPYTELNVANPISYAVSQVPGMEWLNIVISLGAIAGLSSVMLVTLMGQPRIFFSMAVDGLFPQCAATVHPRYKTPYITTLITGAVAAVCSAMLPIDVLSELSSIGTLFAFFMVSIGVLVLRIRQPDLHRGFKAPGGPYFVPIMGALTSGLLICTATKETIYRLFGWMFIGLVVYFAYGRANSRRLRAAKAAAKEVRVGVVKEGEL